MHIAPLERTVVAESERKKNKHHIFAPTANLHQTLRGDRARCAHHKTCHSFLIQRMDPTGCTEKFGLIYGRAVSKQPVMRIT